MPSGAGSLSMMVKTALARVPKLAPPVGLLRLSSTVSLDSLMVSLRMGTATVLRCDGRFPPRPTE